MHIDSIPKQCRIIRLWNRNLLSPVSNAGSKKPFSYFSWFFEQSVHHHWRMWP